MRSFLIFLMLCSLIPVNAGDDIPGILSMRKRAEVKDNWLSVRFQTVLPQIMRREKTDMWILIA